MKKPAALEASRALYPQTNTGVRMDTKNVSTKTAKPQILLQGRRMTWAELSALFISRKAQLTDEVAS